MHTNQSHVSTTTPENVPLGNFCAFGKQNCFECIVFLGFNCLYLAGYSSYFVSYDKFTLCTLLYALFRKTDVKVA